MIKQTILMIKNICTEIIKMSMCLSIAAVWRSVQFGEGEELDAAEGELPAAHILLHVLHPATISVHTHTSQKHTD